MKHRRLVLLQHRVSQQFSPTAEQLEELLLAAVAAGDSCDAGCCCHAVSAVADSDVAADPTESSAGAAGGHGVGAAADSEFADASVPSAGAVVAGWGNGGLIGGTPETTPCLDSLESCAVTLIMHLNGQPLRPALYHTQALHSTIPWHIAQHISGVGM